MGETISRESGLALIEDARRWQAAYTKERDENASLKDALQRIAAQQPAMLKTIEANGFVFDSIGNEPGNWQHLAFTIYTSLCEIDIIARTALKDDE